MNTCETDIVLAAGDSTRFGCLTTPVRQEVILSRSGAAPGSLQFRSGLTSTAPSSGGVLGDIGAPPDLGSPRGPERSHGDRTPPAGLRPASLRTGRTDVSVPGP